MGQEHTKGLKIILSFVSNVLGHASAQMVVLNKQIKINGNCLFTEEVHQYSLYFPKISTQNKKLTEILLHI